MGYTARPIAFPEVRSFAELFEIVPKGTKGVPWTGDDYKMKTGKRFKSTIEIGPYCSISGKGGYRHLYVKPTASVVEAIKSKTIFCGERDAITFELVNRDGGETLVVAKHSLIIGSVWLALIDSATVPASEDE